MKKILRGSLIGVLALFVLVVAVYILLGLYYVGRFPCFTWINGVYCTGKTVNEVNRELIQKDNYEGIAILDESGARLFVAAKDVDMTIDYTDSLRKNYNNQNPFGWGLFVFNNQECTYDPVVSLDKDKLHNAIASWEIFIDPRDFKCAISQTGEGYVLENSSILVPAEGTINELAYSSMLDRESVLDLGRYDDCYDIIDLTVNAKDKVALFDKIDEIQNNTLSYEIDENTVPLDSKEISRFFLTKYETEELLAEKVDKRKPGQGLFIVGNEEKKKIDAETISYIDNIAVDENKNPIISEKKIYGFLEKVAGNYNTGWMMDRYREGLSSNVIINVNRKGKGSIYDIDTEFEYLKAVFLGDDLDGEAVLSGTRDQVRKFTLAENAEEFNAADNIGDTYIEIDMSNQELTYYVDGEINMQFPIVTGNINRGRGTPTGIFQIYNKRYHTYLRGADYVSYVNYWLGVNKGIGIHDALWRKKFGEEIYKSDGSHGCINCPLEQVEVLWNIVEVGTPTILYY